MAYRPPQRVVRALVLAGPRWIEGAFHVPRLHGFAEHLAQERAFFTLTDVHLGGGRHAGYLALRREAALVIVPEVPERLLLLAAHAGEVPREVRCFLERAAIHGYLAVRPDVRTSDVLAHQGGHLVLRRATVSPALPGRARPFPVVFVNPRAVLAVAEELCSADPALAAPTPAPLRRVAPAVAGH